MLWESQKSCRRPGPSQSKVKGVGIVLRQETDAAERPVTFLRQEALVHILQENSHCIASRTFKNDSDD